MTEVRQDSLTPARHYARGELAGFVHGCMSTHATLEAEAKALVAMEHLGFDVDTRWAIMDTAHHHAEVEHAHRSSEPADPYTLRHAAALAVIQWLRLVLRRQKAR